MVPNDFTDKLCIKLPDSISTRIRKNGRTNEILFRKGRKQLTVHIGDSGVSIKEGQDKFKKFKLTEFDKVFLFVSKFFNVGS